MSKQNSDNDRKSAPSNDSGPQKPSRRSLFARTGLAAGGLAAFAVGYKETLGKGARGLTSGSAGAATADAVRGRSLLPEYQINPETGARTVPPNSVTAMAGRLGWWTPGGVLARGQQAARTQQ